MTFHLIAGLVALVGFVSADFPDCVSGPVSQSINLVALWLIEDHLACKQYNL